MTSNPPTTAAEILRRAKARIEDPTRRTCMVLARDAAGRSVDPRSPEATRWCALGALAAEGAAVPTCEGKTPDAASWDPYNFLRAASGGSVTRINDGNRHEKVLDMFDDAISRAVKGNPS